MLNAQLPGFAPGVYVGMDIEKYHADPAVSTSGVKLFRRRPSGYWDASCMNTDPEEKEDKSIALKFGTAYHTRLLEPHLFRYAIKAGVKESKIPGTLGEGEFKRLMRMERVLLGEPDISKLLRGGIPEVSIFWRDEITGLMCRVRYDYFAPAWGLDLKTTENVEEQKMRFVPGEYGWDIGGAMYAEGARNLRLMIAAGYKLPPEFTQAFVDEFMAAESQLFGFLMQEKKPPFDPRLELVTPELAEVGYHKLRAALEGMQECFTKHGSNRWPTYHQSVSGYEFGFKKVNNLTLDRLPQNIQYN